MRQLRDELRRAGTDTARLSDAQAELNRKMESTATRLDAARAKSDTIAVRRSRDADRLENLSRVSLVAQGAGHLGRGVLNALAAPIRAGRGVAAAKGDLRSLGLDQAATGAIAARGRDVSLQIPDLDTESFTAAAYDIRSGIEGLSTEGIAGLTEASAVTARATKGDVANMTGLVGSIPAHAGEPAVRRI